VTGGARTFEVSVRGNGVTIAGLRCAPNDCQRFVSIGDKKSRCAEARKDILTTLLCILRLTILRMLLWDGGVGGRWGSVAEAVKLIPSNGRRGRDLIKRE
jgi:hypothetical protein